MGGWIGLETKQEGLDGGRSDTIGRRAGDQSSLKGKGFSRAHAQEGSPRLSATDSGSSSVSNHVYGLCPILHSQCDAEVGIGPDVFAHYSARTLGSQ